MFEHPGDVLMEERQDPITSVLQSIMDVDDTYHLKLPHFIPPDDPDSLPRISQDTMVRVLNGQYDQVYDDTVVVDCRFEYEYSGGHIQGASNYNDKEELAQELFKAPSKSTTLLIFHCEYSAHRAPLM